MAKVAFLFIFSLVMSIHVAHGIGSPAGDKSGQTVLPFAHAPATGMSTAPAPAETKEAPSPTVSSMRGVANAFANKAAEAVEDAKEGGSSIGSWFKEKFSNMFGGKSDDNKNGSPAPAPAA